MSLRTIWPSQTQLEIMEPVAIRETVLERAVAAGLIPDSRRDDYRAMWERDLEGTVAVLASLAPGPKPSDVQTLHDFERQQGDELLASASAAFPELRRRASRGLPPVRPVAPTHRAGWYRRTNGSPVVKDAGRATAPWWQNYVPPDRGLAPQREGLEAEAAPFPDGFNIRD